MCAYQPQPFERETPVTSTCEFGEDGPGFCADLLFSFAFTLFPLKEAQTDAIVIEEFGQVGQPNWGVSLAGFVINDLVDELALGELTMLIAEIACLECGILAVAG